ncbi:MAG: single-stranded DNA-binding protein [Clostridiales bacterium]|uniref:single-stranded DNA-binding protein n=1 Tax=Anaerocaecibacter muris TaxID=2941513 RepID=UPI00203C7493|nr:single-stranded DNA-binding protein [Anaerocaecibacter muris]MDE6965620.1 single-stranded DNA-binding protein [Clostridiales bacterium]
MKNEKSTNTVYLQGRVGSAVEYSHDLYGERFYEFKLNVPRLSEHLDVIPITASEALVAGLQADELIAVSGQFRSFNRPDGERSRLILSVFAREITQPQAEVNPNAAELIGYICKPPIYRTTPFNREICDVLLAVNRAYSKSDYIPCIAWGKNARLIKNAPVGQKMCVAGRIQSRQYTKRLDNGETELRTAYEFSIGAVEFLQKESEVASTSDEM